MDNPDTFEIEVAYARPDTQRIVVVTVPPGTTAIDAVRLSNIEKMFPEIDIDRCEIGIFSHSVKHGYVLNAGDRVEIYRPLRADPREVRRQLAAEGKTMGRNRSGNSRVT